MSWAKVHIQHLASCGGIYTFLENVELAKHAEMEQRDPGQAQLFFKSKTPFLCGLPSAKMQMLQHFFCAVQNHLAKYEWGIL